MAAAKVLEAEVWCPCCLDYYGKIYRKEVRDGFYQNVTVPKVMPKRCNKCEGVLVRKT